MTASPVLLNPRATDDDLGAAAAENFQIPVRPAVRDAVVRAIARERLRCVHVIQAGVRHQQRELQKIEAQIQLQISAGGPIDDLASARQMSMAAIGAYSMAARAVAIKPGDCYTCGGSGQVATSVVLAGGQRGSVVCPKCGGDGEDKSPAALAAPA